MPECVLCSRKIYDRATGTTYLGGEGSAWAHELCVSGARAEALGVKPPLTAPLSVEGADELMEPAVEGAHAARQKVVGDPGPAHASQQRADAVR